MTTADADSSDVNAKPVRRKRSMGEVIRALGQPKVAAMLALGFSCGVPFLLIGNTLGYWMRDENVDLKTIGFASWVGLFYSLKFLWAPIMDRVALPILGRRRGWMLAAQLGIGAGLFGMAAIGPFGASFFWVAGFTAFCAASQDIVVDAWRIEIAQDADELGLLTAAHQLGYRAAMLATDALILLLVGGFKLDAVHFTFAGIGWTASYGIFAFVMAIGLGATLFAKEPVASGGATAAIIERPLWTPRGLYDAIAGPFIEFFKTHGAFALLMLVTITFYHLSDYLRGPIGNPYYHDLGISKATVGLVRAGPGLWATLAGIAAGGLAAAKFGYFRTLIIGAILQPIFIAAFALFATWGTGLGLFTTVMCADNFAIGFSGVALVAYMSSLTSLGYTASQYAVMTSALAWTGKTLKGFSGVVVENLQKRTSPLEGYAWFYVAAAALGIPAIILCFVLAARVKKQEEALAA
jgi:PAT family beta-lactamase induction signal transducer AmpG